MRQTVLGSEDSESANINAANIIYGASTMQSDINDHLAFKQCSAVL